MHPFPSLPLSFAGSYTNEVMRTAEEYLESLRGKAIVLFQSCITSMLHKLVNLRLEGFFMHPLLAGFIGKEESNSSREGPGPEYNMQRVLKVANIHMIIVCNLNA